MGQMKCEWLFHSHLEAVSGVNRVGPIYIYANRGLISPALSTAPLSKWGFNHGSTYGPVLVSKERGESKAELAFGFGPIGRAVFSDQAFKVELREKKVASFRRKGERVTLVAVKSNPYL